MRPTPFDADAPFGTFAPQGMARLLIAASRSTFLGHAEPRKLIWRALQRRHERCFDVSAHGAHMRLHPFDSSLERVLLLRPQKYCPEEFAFLRRSLAPGMTLIDAGANVGAMSLPFADLPGVEIVAVEASPVALARLAFNVAANGCKNVRIAPVALSDADGVVSFVSDARDLKLSAVDRDQAQGHGSIVPATTFASLLSKYDIGRPYVLKIDVEGHEDRVLLPFFAGHQPDDWPRHVLIEAIERQGIPECIGFMLAHGYRKVLATKQNVGLSLG
jgi:FkbM family methyltransferase